MLILELVIVLFVCLLAGFAVSKKIDRLAIHPKIHYGYMSVLALYALILITLTIQRYHNYHSELIDLSYYYMTVQQLSNGQNPRIWDIPSRFVLGDHVEPILLLFVPFIKLINSPLVLFAGQVIWVVSGCIPLYLVTKFKLRSSFTAFSVCLTYLSFSGLQMGYAYGFHPIVLFPPFFFWLWYAFETKRHILYYMFLFLTLMVKEEAALILLSVGFYQSVVRKRWKTGIVTTTFSLLWAFICFRIIFPTFNPGIGFGHFGQYLEAIKNPASFISSLFIPFDKIMMMFQTFTPIAWLPWLNPASLFLLLPSLLEKLLSNNIARLNGFHYSAALAGCMMIATIESLYRLKSKLRIISIILLFISIFSIFRYGYAPFLPSRWVYEFSSPSKDVVEINRIIDTFPPNAQVSAQYQIAAHMSWPYSKLLPLPQPNESADYVLLNTHLPLVLTTKEYVVPYLQELEKNSNYELRYTKTGVLVFIKK